MPLYGTPPAVINLRRSPSLGLVTLFELLRLYVGSKPRLDDKYKHQRYGSIAGALNSELWPLAKKELVAGFVCSPEHSRPWRLTSSILGVPR